LTTLLQKRLVFALRLYTLTLHPKAANRNYGIFAASRSSSSLEAITCGVIKRWNAQPTISHGFKINTRTIFPLRLIRAFWVAANTAK